MILQNVHACTVNEQSLWGTRENGSLSRLWERSATIF